MDAVSQSILGDFLPLARVNRIVLQNRAPDFVFDNPHVIDPGEGGATPQGGGVNPVDQDDSNPLSVELYFNIKDTFGDNLISSWYSNQDFKKYLRIYIVQIKESNIYDQLKFNIKDKFSFFNIMSNNTSQDDYKVIDIDDPEADTQILDQNYVEINNDGKRYYSFNFNTSFNLVESRPQHLSYFYFVGLNVSQMANDFGFDFYPDATDYYELGAHMFYLNDIKSELVIKDGSLKETGFVYGTKNSGGSEIWKGQVYYNQSKAQYEGIQFNPNGVAQGPPTPLIQRRVKNRKIQDFRIREKIFDIPFDLSFIESSIYAPLAKAASEKRIVISIPQKPLLGILHPSIAPDNGIRLFFSFNFHEALKRESKFRAIHNSFLPEYIKQEISKQNIYTFFKIDKVVPHPFAQASSPHIVPPGVEPDKEYFVAMAPNAGKEITFNGPSKINPLTGKSESIGQVGKRLYLQTEKTNSGVHHFELLDASPVQYNPNSKGQINSVIPYYHIQVKIQDGAEAVLRNALDSMLESMSPALDRYNTYATAAGFFNYDVSKFNDVFKNNDQVQQDYEIIKNNVLVMMIAVQMLAAPYITKQGVLNDLDAAYEPYSKFTSKITNLISPSYGNPTGIASLMQIKNQVCSILQGIFGMKPNNKSSTVPEKENTPGSSVTAELSFDLKRFFIPFQDLMSYRDTGYDFLSNVPGNNYVDYPPDVIKSQQKVVNDQSPTNPMGLTRITKEQYESRVTAETSKYFVDVETSQIALSTPFAEVQNLNFNLDSKKYTFLTPTIVGIGKDFFPVFPIKLDSFVEEPYRKALSRIVKVNVDEVNPSAPLDPGGPEQKEFAEDNEKDQFGYYKYEEEDEDAPDNPDEGIENAADIGNKSEAELLLPNNWMYQYLYKPALNSLNDSGVMSNTNYDLTSKQSCFYKNGGVLEFLKLPNAIKSLFAASLSPGLVKFKYFNTPEPYWLGPTPETSSISASAASSHFIFNFMYIYKVEYFSGYYEGSAYPEEPTEVSMLQEEWKELTPEVFQNNAGLLCRLVKYKNTNWVFGYSDETLDMPIYNQTFILGNVDNAAANEEPPPQEDFEEEELDPEDMHSDTPPNAEEVLEVYEKIQLPGVGFQDSDAGGGGNNGGGGAGPGGGY
jgi:hypothetical protein